MRTVLSRVPLPGGWEAPARTSVTSLKTLEQAVLQTSGPGGWGRESLWMGALELGAC